MSLLNDHLQIRVLDRLGLKGALVPDLETLDLLYAAWCRHVPFDNIRKMIALRSSGNLPLPGLEAFDFFENWLNNGSGATCWLMANALAELLKSIGFKTYRIAGSVRDLGIINHGSVKVAINGTIYLADAALLLNVILPLDQRTHVHNDPVYPVELEPDEDSHLVWMKTPPGMDYFCCRIFSKPVDFPFFLDRYEDSRERSIFNQRLYARRNHPGKLTIFWGNVRFIKTAKGINRDELTREQLCAALNEEIGISEVLIKEWIACGALEASFEPPSGQPPPQSQRKPPSQR